MKENFSKRVQRIIKQSKEEAIRLGHSYVGSEHLLLGMLKEDSGLSKKVLDVFDINIAEMVAMIEDMIKSSGATMTLGHLPLTRRAERILRNSFIEASNRGENIADDEHILLALLKEPEGIACDILKTFSLDYDTVGDLIESGNNDQSNIDPGLTSEISGNIDESAKLTGAIPVANGGTGLTSLTASKGIVVNSDADGLEFGDVGADVQPAQRDIALLLMNDSIEQNRVKFSSINQTVDIYQDANSITSLTNTSRNASEFVSITDVSANATGSYESTATTIPTATAKMSCVILYADAAGTATLNTDLKLSLSSNNGTAFTQVTLVSTGRTFSSGIKVAVSDEVSTTSGTQVKYKVEFANQSGSKTTRVHGVTMIHGGS